MGNLKVAVVGAGQVGGTCAQRILERKLADVALIDIEEGLAKGKALDLGEASAVEGYNFKIVGGANFALMEGATAVVMTAGLARKPGMTREDLLIQNAKIVKDVSEKIKRHCPQAIIIMVTNPLDIMTYLAYKITGFENRRVFGMAGILDSARLRFFVSERLGLSPDKIEAFVLGGHGDSMVPLVEQTKVNGRPITEFLSKADLEGLIKRTRDGGAEIVSLLKTGSAYYAPSSAACQMLDAVLKDKKEILPVSAYLDGEYGLKDVYCGVPAKIGKTGVEDIVEFELSEAELSSLRKSAAQVKEGIDYLLKAKMV